MQNSFQVWAIGVLGYRGFRARPRGNWVEVLVDKDWREIMSVDGVLRFVEREAV